MLVLARRLDERIILDGGRITITVVGLLPDKVRLGIEAPADCRIDREEVHRLRRLEDSEGHDDG
jgi:carbon storage regulator CsrA